MTTAPSPLNGAPAKRALWPFALAIVIASLAPFVFWPSLLTKATDSDFMPHRFCYMNTPGLIWANVSADAITGLSYIAIAATLAVLLHRTRRDIPFSWVFLAFGLFIVACGGTHLMEVLTVWKPYYWLSADVKIVTALASLVTAISLPRLVPRTTSLLAASKVAAERKAQVEAANLRLTELERMSVQLAHRAAAGVAYWEFDYKTGERRRWGDVAGVFGRNESEIATPEQFLSIVHPDDREKVGIALDQAFRNHTEYDAEYRITMPEGNIHWLLGRGQPYYDDKGNPVSMVGVNMDVTARKLSDAALQQSEKLAVTGRLAATIAHEINNPLSTVTDLVYSIAREPTATPAVQSYANIAQEELKRIAQIVKNTLGFHRESSSPTTVSITDLLDSALALHEPQIRKKKIRLDKCYSNGLTVLVQPGELRQVFANLVNNAIDAVPEGGCLRVRMRSASGYVKIAVIDNGIGIPRDRRAQLFQPFFTTKGEKGTGLGLWVSRSLVEKNGGRIAVRSFGGSNVHGTAFSVVLPLTMPVKEAA
jgi:PAS domain S-box-containing protein